MGHGSSKKNGLVMKDGIKPQIVNLTGCSDFVVYSRRLDAVHIRSEC